MVAWSARAERLRATCGLALDVARNDPVGVEVSRAQALGAKVDGVLPAAGGEPARSGRHVLDAHVIAAAARRLVLEPVIGIGAARVDATTKDGEVLLDPARPKRRSHRRLAEDELRNDARLGALVGRRRRSEQERDGSARRG